MLKEFDQDTITAISTPLGEGGIGVIRLSGPESIAVADKIFRSTKKTLVKDQESFSVQYGHIVSQDGQKVDEVLLLLMRAPKSYTCEDVIEISAHGGSAVLKSILDLAVQNGARLAARGEFTKRAFLNGRIDLLQAEAVLDLVKAKTEMGRKWAVAQLEGVLSEKMKSLKNALVDILSHLEASIDFPEDLIDAKPLAAIQKRLKVLEKDVEELLAKSSLGFIAKNGIKIVIAGRPNVGKSSLMNRLSKTNRVIVTPYAGTTRDAVEEEIQISGFPVRIVDTAGIQETHHPIEKEGIERSKAAVAEADLVLYVLDGSQVWAKEDESLFKELEDKRKILVINKSDLPQKIGSEELKRIAGKASCILTSCIKDGGVDLLEHEIFRSITNGQAQVSEEAVINSVRQKELLEKTLENINNAKKACSDGLSPEFVAVDVRLALDHLGSLAGEVVTDDILEALFSQFCIGK